MEVEEAGRVVIIRMTLDLGRLRVLDRGRILVPAHHCRTLPGKMGSMVKVTILMIKRRGMMVLKRRRKTALSRQRKLKKRKKIKPARLLPGVLGLLRSTLRELKSEVVVVARVVVATVDPVVERENESEKVTERVTGPPVPDLLDLCPNHVLLYLQSLGRILQRHYPILPLPRVILEIDGGAADQNVVARNSIVGPLHGETSILKTDLRRINEQFLFLSW
mmetsp:Transcript_11283/g.27098  ORF Transcript_11283/g.27098 Transcript_11283/m.27098 type:complete len:220 (-) Transcript_11283:4236-4895(-)